MTVRAPQRQVISHMQRALHPERGESAISKALGGEGLDGVASGASSIVSPAEIASALNNKIHMRILNWV